MDAIQVEKVQTERNAREKETQLDRAVSLDQNQPVFPWAEWFQFQKEFPLESLLEMRDANEMKSVSSRLDRILHRDGLAMALDVLPTEELSRLMQTLSVCLARSALSVM